MPATNSKENLVFPDDTDLIISEILKKYGLEETDEELIDKFEKEEKSRGEILALLIFKTAEEEISFQGLISSLKIELKISSKTAEEIAKDLKKEILDLVIERPAELQEELPEKIAPEKTANGKDVYRESLE